MAWRSKSRLGLCAAIMGVAAVAWGIWRFEGDSKKTANTNTQATAAPRDDRGFVGSQACHRCHPKEFESFSKHPMALSMSSVRDAEPIEDYAKGTAFSPTPQRKYVVEKAGDRVIHHEIGLDQAGQQIYDQAEEVHYVMGSGSLGRSYVLDRDGILFMSPISWYSQKSRWDLSPRYEPQNHPRFDRRVPERCIQCHAGRMNHARPPTGADYERYGQPPFAETGIGCERCHGPGEAHIAWQSQAQQAGTDPMIRLSSLSPAKRDDVCNQCHLIGDFQVLRANRRHSDFRPGDHLGDIWCVFEIEGGEEDVESAEAVSQVKQMRESRCYVASRGGLGCISCHEPHSIPKESEKANHYNQRCLKCHKADHCSISNEERQRTASGSCIQCHMPRLSASDVPHVSETDHRILRRREARPSTVSERGAHAIRIYGSHESSLPELEEARARALFLAERAKTEHNTEFAHVAAQQLSQLVPAFSDDVLVWDSMAFCEILAGHSARATEFWSRAVAKSADNPEILDSLAGQLMDQGEITQALALVDRSIELDPWKSERHLRRSKLVYLRGELASAIASANRAVDLNPSNPNLYKWLADLHRTAGNTEQSGEFESKWSRLRGGDPKK
jgi:tetratricopeptide (TPR) repeat protein